MFGIPTSVLATVAHDHHRLRQKALLPFSSQKSVNLLEPLIQSILDSLCANMERHHRARKPINLLYAFSAMSTDVIRQYSFGRSTRDVEKEEFCPQWYDAVMITSELSMLLKQFVWMLPMMAAMPEWIAKKTFKSVYLLIQH